MDNRLSLFELEFEFLSNLYIRTVQSLLYERMTCIPGVTVMLKSPSLTKSKRLNLTRIRFCNPFLIPAANGSYPGKYKKVKSDFRNYDK